MGPRPSSWLVNITAIVGDHSEEAASVGGFLHFKPSPAASPVGGELARSSRVMTQQSGGWGERSGTRHSQRTHARWVSLLLNRSYELRVACRYEYRFGFGVWAATFVAHVLRHTPLSSSRTRVGGARRGTTGAGDFVIGPTGMYQPARNGS
jgi:hypothetical protein